MNGLEFLTTILLEKSFSNRLHLKNILLMYDLTINDENIFDDN